METRLLTESRRRCCLCVFLDKNFDEQQVQIAHISRDRSDSSYENLVVLCLNHHDRYDSRPSQSKGYTAGEAKVYKERLIHLIQRWESGPSQFLPSAFASAILGTEVHPPPLSTQRLHLRGAAEESEAAVARALAGIGQLGLGNILGQEWELRTKRLGGRFLLVGLHSYIQGDWLAWVADSSPRASAEPEVTIDILGQFHSRPAVDIIPHRDSYCLLIHRLTFHGTGAERHSEIWYVMRGSELVEVLAYPTRAYVSGWCSFRREIRAIPLQRPETLLHGVSLEISFRADYFTDQLASATQEDTQLFHEERLFHATWDDDAELFVPTPASQLSAADVEALFEDGDEEFFHRHRKIIEGLLRSDVLEQRLWAESIHTRYAPKNSAEL
jgi:hypothetical protein